MRKNKTIIILFSIVFFFIMLSGCSNKEKNNGNNNSINQFINEVDYHTFITTLESKEYTGFVYVNEEFEKEQGQMDAIIKAFENQKQELLYHNNVEATEEEKEQKREDAPRGDIPFPRDEILYLQNGKEVGELDIRENIIENEKMKELEDFIDRYGK